MTHNGGSRTATATPWFRSLRVSPSCAPHPVTLSEHSPWVDLMMAAITISAALPAPCGPLSTSSTTEKGRSRRWNRQPTALTRAAHYVRTLSRTSIRTDQATADPARIIEAMNVSYQLRRTIPVGVILFLPFLHEDVELVSTGRGIRN
jgi:hypothetical protein